MTTQNFEDHPNPDGLAVSHEEIVERMRELVFRMCSAIEIDENVLGIDGADQETLNLAISALGGTPVKLAEAEPGEGEDLSQLLNDVPF